MEKIKNVIISALISCIVSLITFFLLLKVYPGKQIEKVKMQKNKDSLKNNLDSSLYKLEYFRNEEEKIKTENERLIDSLNVMLVKEITGSGSSKKMGYGPRARELKNFIDSLKVQYRIKTNIDSGSSEVQ